VVTIPLVWTNSHEAAEELMRVTFAQAHRANPLAERTRLVRAQPLGRLTTTHSKIAPRPGFWDFEQLVGEMCAKALAERGYLQA
jgi:hypothetical protein